MENNQQLDELNQLTVNTLGIQDALKLAHKRLKTFRQINMDTMPPSKYIEARTQAFNDEGFLSKNGVEGANRRIVRRVKS